MLLKHCAIALYQPVHHLFSLSLSLHYIPKEWRIHQVTPIHKSGDRSRVENYRPISLLCTLSKVLERLVYDRTIKFVVSSLSSAQFGFRRQLSSLHQLLSFLTNIYDNVDNKCQSDVIYLDFKKAFDSVPHNELLVKLWSIGITNNLWEWLKAYLSSRLQCVAMNNFHSDLLPVISGPREYPWPTTLPCLCKWSSPCCLLIECSTFCWRCETPPWDPSPIWLSTLATRP